VREAQALGFTDLVFSRNPFLVVGGENRAEIVRQHQVRMRGRQLFCRSPEDVYLLKLQRKLTQEDFIV
jgi:hypothetical protein